jgi:multicomponent Na+:H+ antiporter subunit D
VGDVYETGSILSINYIMSLLKFGIFGIFIKFYLVIILQFQTTSVNLLLNIIIIASFAFSFIALRSFTLKRILAFTSVNQMGYIFMGILGGTIDTISSAIIYMLVYTITLSILFICLNHCDTINSEK